MADYTDSEVSVALGDGTGKFPTVNTIGLGEGSGPEGIVAADFNKDSKLDLATADYSSSEVTILLGNGDGTFQAPEQISLGGPDGAAYLVAADFNKDGDLDLAVTNASSNSVSILQGDGKGGFTDVQDVSVGNFGTVKAIATGEFNGDGYPDLVATIPGNDVVAVLLNDGNGKFDVPTGFTPLPGKSGFYHPAPGASGLADITLLPRPDGLSDLVVACETSNTINIFFNQGNGTFFPAITVTVPGTTPFPTALTSADFAGAGHSQIAVADNVTGDVYIFTPMGVGNTATFLPGPATSTSPPTGPVPLQGAVEPADLNKLLSQLETLQGGNPVTMGPFDNTSEITPAGSTPPPFMAFTSLVYPPNLVPLSLDGAGTVLDSDSGDAQRDRRGHESWLHAERRLPRRLAITGFE